MLGCGLAPNTSMHAIEELVAPPYLFGEPLVYTMVLEDGTRMDRLVHAARVRRLAAAV